MKHKLLGFLLVVVPLFSFAQSQTLSLEDCHNLALQSNKNYKISQEKVEESEALRKLAFSQFFPKATANGLYLHNEKNIQLLSDDRQNKLNNMGSSVVNSISSAIPSWMPSSITQNIVNALNTNLGVPLNAIGSDITDVFDVDMSNVWAGAVTIYQPLYMGGKIRAMYKSAKALSSMSQLEAEKAQDDLLISVDEAFWRVISLQQKVSLAQQYSDLLDTLSYNVQLMVDAEVGTQGDLTKVRVKANEAKMSLIKATSGLALSKMLLLQMCGLDMNGDYEFVAPMDMMSKEALDSIDMQEVFSSRNEIRQLDQACNVADAAVSIARSTLLPNLVAQGSYVVSNPSIFNGFQNKFDGMYTVGAVLNIPICHVGGFYAVKAAKHRRNQVQYQMQDAQDKITLQVNKLNYELKVANAKLAQTESNIDLANENLKLAQESFAAGMINSSDLLQAQTAWMQAKSEQLDASIEVRMAYLYLQQALGRKCDL